MESTNGAKHLIKKCLKKAQANGDIETWEINDEVVMGDIYRIDLIIDGKIRFTSVVKNKCHLSKTIAWNELISIILQSGLKK